MGKGKFSNSGHLLSLREERRDRQKIRDDANSAKLNELSKYLDGTDCRLILRVKNTGACLNAWVNTVTGSLLVATEFCYFNAHIMMLTPPNLQSKYDGCATSFDVRHGLSCIKRGLIISRHNKVRDELLYLDRQNFPSTNVRGKPLIHQGRSISEGGYVRVVIYWIQEVAY